MLQSRRRVHHLAMRFLGARIETDHGALGGTRTPLIVNCLQLASRAALIPLLLPHLGVIAIPAAFAVSATLETIALAGIVVVKLRHAQAGR